MDVCVCVSPVSPLCVYVFVLPDASAPSPAASESIKSRISRRMSKMFSGPPAAAPKPVSERVLEDATRDISPVLAAKKTDIVRALGLLTEQGGFKLKPVKVAHVPALSLLTAALSARACVCLHAFVLVRLFSCVCARVSVEDEFVWTWCFFPARIRFALSTLKLFCLAEPGGSECSWRACNRREGSEPVKSGTRNILLTPSSHVSLSSL